MSSLRTTSPALLLLLAGVALAQPQGARSQLSAEAKALASTVAADPASHLIPLHTQEPDPVHGPYGLWAAGTNYKASFHDGFVFYTALGRDYPRNLPLRWTTESVAVGDTRAALPAARPAPAHTDWRCELALGDVTEAYDIRADGVEQTFVLARPLPGRGDLTITGRIETELQAAVVPAAVQSLTFRDADGNPILHYGAATAIDANGSRIGTTTSFDGERIRLTVPGTWLAEAIYPVTVDPLTSPVAVTASLRQFYAVDTGHDAESHEVMVLVSSDFSARDVDTHAYLVTNDFGGRVQVFADVQTYGTFFAQCCFVGGADRWLVACGRERGSATGNLAVYVHPRANYALNSGRIITVAQPSGSQDWQPSIGGSFHPTLGTKALITWRRDVGPGDTSTSRVWYALVDPLGNATSIPTLQQFQVTTSTNRDQGWPTVNRCSNGGDWIILYSEYDLGIANDDWDIDAAVVLTSGSVFQRFRLAQDGLLTHKILPKIEGNDGRYFYSYTEKPIDVRETSIHGKTIKAEQFDWTGSLAHRSGPVTLDSSTNLSLTTGEFTRGIAYDRKTVSHAVVTYQTTLGVISLMRIGINARVVEHIALFGGGGFYAPTTVYNPDYLTFMIGYVELNEFTHNVRFRHMDYANATCQITGSSCFGTLACANGSLPAARAVPHRGSSQFAVDLTNTAPNTFHIPMLGFGQGNVPLPGGCQLLLNPAQTIFFLPGVVSSTAGTIHYPLAIPEDVIGDVHFQWLRLLLNATQTSPGMKLSIR